MTSDQARALLDRLNTLGQRAAATGARKLTEALPLTPQARDALALLAAEGAGFIAGELAALILGDEEITVRLDGAHRLELDIR